MTWEGYFSIQRITDNTDEPEWVQLITLVNELRGIGRDANQIIRNRGMVEPNGFWWDTGEVDEEDNPVFEWYANTYIYAANFPATAVQFDKFADKCETAFDLQPGSVTYTTQQVTLRDRPSCVATFTHNAVNYFRVALLGCASDTELCTVKESNGEALQLLADDPVAWGEVVA